MSVERMRRVDEAMREVLSDALTHELKDPRVGFVTVTDVKTSPDLRHARVFVSVLGDAAAVAGDAGGPAVRARLPAGARRQRAAPQAHARADLLLRRHRGARGAPGADASMRRAGGEHGRSADYARARSLDELRDRGRASCSSRTRTPTATRSGSLVAMHRILRALGKDSVMFMAADEFPLPYEYRFFELDGLQSELPADLDERTIVFLDCGNIDRNPVEAPSSATTPTSSTSTTTTTTRASARSTTSSRTRRARPRSCGTSCARWASSRRSRSPRRSTSGSSPTPASSCTRTPACARTSWRPSSSTPGVDVHGIYRRLYEGMPYAKLELLARALRTCSATTTGG